MQFKLTAFATLAVAIALAAPSALAATCYGASGCPTCESRGSMESARQTFCGGNGWTQASSLAWGDAHVNLEGRFYSQQECFDGFENIIDDCYGKEDGGIYTYDYNGDSARLDVNFCSCE
ncbi:hypothetical protein C8Q77DRAFT_1055478 [Trametes polyzona]|nr:hypothetical protein C8Q77DRAFT_1055478 [Trametes polyzona]